MKVNGSIQRQKKLHKRYEVSGNDSDINNVSGNQYKDSAIHNEGKEG